MSNEEKSYAHKNIEDVKLCSLSTHILNTDFFSSLQNIPLWKNLFHIGNTSKSDLQKISKASKVRIRQK